LLLEVNYYINWIPYDEHTAMAFLVSGAGVVWGYKGEGLLVIDEIDLYRGNADIGYEWTRSYLFFTGPQNSEGNFIDPSPLPQGEGFFEALNNCFFEHYGLTSFSARAATLALSAPVPKSWLGRFRAPGSSRFTNLLSELALKNSKNLSRTVMGTTNGVRSIARFMPYFNGGLLTYDGLSIASCVKKRLTGQGLNSLENAVNDLLP
jgi:hypothetical protein